MHDGDKYGFTTIPMWTPPTTIHSDMHVAGIHTPTATPFKVFLKEELPDSLLLYKLGLLLTFHSISQLFPRQEFKKHHWRLLSLY